ncbi:MAG: hypothetical protein KKE37_05645 [Verrucomicrobia bacterium]|nr:hypothetical protein [Verrucomicrobiota bacterium]MBU4291239.1 hypothetical protein [Verrucomicrobiota bacterium]MBU4428821.1 hypothetical protein [Verrucomicrobiota bacterium]MCG2680965.1 hypothetical protein [Kiritimatiellia bacterium]
MNLQVNFILESEMRSGSTVSLKFVVRVVAVVVPVLMGIIIAGLIMGGRSARQSLRFAMQEKSQLDPVYQSVIGLKQELNECRQVADVLEGWGTSRTDWRLLLRYLQGVVPASIQFLRLTVNETIGRVDNIPARMSAMYLKGKVTGERAEDDVQLLDNALKEKPIFTNLFLKVEVKRFEAAENVADKNTRVFEIECIQVPKKIGKPKVVP